MTQIYVCCLLATSGGCSFKDRGKSVSRVMLYKERQGLQRKEVGMDGGHYSCCM